MEYWNIPLLHVLGVQTAYNVSVVMNRFGEDSSRSTFFKIRCSGDRSSIHSTPWVKSIILKHDVAARIICFSNDVLSRFQTAVTNCNLVFWRRNLWTNILGKELFSTSKSLHDHRMHGWLRAFRKLSDAMMNSSHCIVIVYSLPCMITSLFLPRAWFFIRHFVGATIFNLLTF